MQEITKMPCFMGFAIVYKVGLTVGMRQIRECEPIAPRGSLGELHASGNA